MVFYQGRNGFPQDPVLFLTVISTCSWQVPNWLSMRETFPYDVSLFVYDEGNEILIELRLIRARTIQLLKYQQLSLGT